MELGSFHKLCNKYGWVGGQQKATKCLRKGRYVVKNAKKHVYIICESYLIQKIAIRQIETSSVLMNVNAPLHWVPSTTPI